MHSQRRTRSALKSSSRRLLASAAAALAVAQVAVPARAASRDWNAATGNWSTSANWTPTGMPGGLDVVSIGNTAAAENATVQLNVNSTIAQLTLTDGMTLDTNLFSIFVGTTTSLSGANTVGSTTFATTLRIENGIGSHDFRTDNLNVTNLARVNLVGGGILRVDDFFLLDGSSRLTGDGVINLTGSAASVFQIDGDVAPGFGGITINQQGTGRIDLDGGIGGDRTIDVTNTNGTGTAFASLTVNGDQLLDAFDDSLEIGSSNSVNMNLTNGWTLGGAGKLRFTKNPSFSGPAQLNGSTVTFNGDIEFSGNALGQINAPAIINPTMSVSMPDISLMDFNAATTINGGNFTLGHFARLTFDGPTTVNGGTFTTFNNNALDGDVTFNGTTTYGGTVTFNGNARQDGNVVVNTAATINANLFDMDGSAPHNFYTLAGDLTINADAIDPFDGDFNGAISVVGNGSMSAGNLTVNLPAGQSWRANGTVSLQGPSSNVFNTALSGSPVALAGHTHVDRNNAVTARVDFAGGGTTTINPASTLRIVGGASVADPNTISGGLITGEGTLQSSGARALVGFGTISTAHISFINGAELRAKGGTLTVNGNAIEDMGVIGTADDTGTLNFSSSYNMASTHRMDLQGGRVVGAAIANNGTITGRGTIANEALSNSKVITAVGGELVLNPTSSLDLDGTLGGVPVVNAIGGDVHVVNALTDAFDGIANIGGGRTMRLGAGWSLGSGGTVNLGGSLVQPATLAGGGLQALFGRVNVSFGGQFDMPTGFLAGSSVSLPNASDQLTLLKGAAINNGATFTGNGSLRNAGASTLDINGTASVGVHVYNAGTIRAGGGNGNVGSISLRSITSAASSTLAVDIGGAGAGTHFDRIEVTNGATLDGTLALTTLNNYSPAYLASHEVIHAGGNGISGTFDTITGGQVTPTKFWAVTYDADSVFATMARPGDANLDGQVNLQDFNILAGHFGQGGGTWQSADFTGDGQVNLMDFNLLAGNFGISASGPDALPGAWAAVAQSVPEPQFAGAFALAGVLSSVRRRRK